MARGVPIGISAQRLRQWALSGGYNTVARGILQDGLTRITGRAIGTYMRDANGEGRRRRDDDGPLRIVTGDYVRGIRRSKGTFRTQGPVVSILRVIDASRLPQSYNELRKNDTPGRYPAHAPAARDETRAIRSLAEKRLARALADAIRGTPLRRAA